MFTECPLFQHKSFSKLAVTIVVPNRH